MHKSWVFTCVFSASPARFVSQIMEELPSLLVCLWCIFLMDLWCNSYWTYSVFLSGFQCNSKWIYTIIPTVFTVVFSGFHCNSK